MTQPEPKVEIRREDWEKATEEERTEMVRKMVEAMTGDPDY